MPSAYAEVTFLMSLTMKNLNEIYFVFSYFCVVQCISAVCSQCELDRTAKRNSRIYETQPHIKPNRAMSTRQIQYHQFICPSVHHPVKAFISQRVEVKMPNIKFFFRSDYVCMYVVAVQHSFSGRCWLYLYRPAAAASSHRSSFRLLEVERVRQTGRNFMMVALR